MDSFLQDWFTHPCYWFAPDFKYDDYLIDLYGHLLEEEWDTESNDLQYHLTQLVVYDQLARHKYRNNEDKIDFYLDKALQVYDFIEKTFDVNKLSVLEWIFFSLPIRHSNNTIEIFKIIHEAWTRLKKEMDPILENHLISFLKASYARCSKNQLEFIEYHSPYEHSVSFESFMDYLDILGYCPLSHYGVDMDEHLYILFEAFIKKYKLKNVIISVSGGVDSQVCNYILKRLEDKYHFNLIAVYIDYGNRSHKEYEFVRDWCIYMGIPLYVRHITEIKRKPCMEYQLRSLYEDYTKTVRFNTYKNVWTNILRNEDCPLVILGHNQDDCFENILTNICRKNKYDNLRGMEEEQVIDSIRFYRPMLSIPKEKIYAFADTVGVPYLQDSTPSWSQRGKIRDIVRPTLHNWNPEMIPALFELSNRMKEHEQMMVQYIKTLLNSLVVDDFNRILLLEKGHFHISKLFWEKLFDELSIPCSYRSLTNFMEILTKNKTQTKVNLNKTTHIIIQDIDSLVKIIIQDS
jgi:tRNA(Ile)-lysidine synthetase-like protein